MVGIASGAWPISTALNMESLLRRTRMSNLGSRPYCPRSQRSAHGGTASTLPNSIQMTQVIMRLCAASAEQVLWSSARPASVHGTKGLAGLASPTILMTARRNSSTLGNEGGRRLRVRETQALLSYLTQLGTSAH